MRERVKKRRWICVVSWAFEKISFFFRLPWLSCFLAVVSLHLCRSPSWCEWGRVHYICPWSPCLDVSSCLGRATIAIHHFGLALSTRVKHSHFHKSGNLFGKWARVKWVVLCTPQCTRVSWDNRKNCVDISYTFRLDTRLTKYATTPTPDLPLSRTFRAPNMWNGCQPCGCSMLIRVCSTREISSFFMVDLL